MLTALIPPTSNRCAPHGSKQSGSWSFDLKIADGKSPNLRTGRCDRVEIEFSGFLFDGLQRFQAIFLKLAANVLDNSSSGIRINLSTQAGRRFFFDFVTDIIWIARFFLFPEKPAK